MRRATVSRELGDPSGDPGGPLLRMSPRIKWGREHGVDPDYLRSRKEGRSRHELPEKI